MIFMIREMSLLDIIAVVKKLNDIHWREVAAFTDYIYGDPDLNDMVIDIYRHPGTKMVCVDKNNVPVILTGIQNGEHKKIGRAWWLVSKLARKRHWKEVFDYWFQQESFIMQEMGMHRFEVLTLNEDHGELPFLVRAGFYMETVQRRRGRNGEDTRLWVKLAKEG